jgi:hypothetical protein
VAESSPGSLVPDQLVALVGMLGDVDSVELKLSVPDANRRSAVAAFGMDPLQAQIRQVVFFDTPDLALDAAGVVVRARRIQGKPGDTVVKLRPLQPAEISPQIRATPGFGVEIDALPGGFVCSGSMKAPVDDVKVKAAIAGELPIRKLFTKAQRAFYATHAPDGLDLDALSVLGPINVLKLKFIPADFGRRLVAEMWLYPDGSRILELSTKCMPAEALTAAVQAKTYVTDKGLDLAAKQQTKTRAALTFFAKELTGGKTDGTSK